MRRRVLDPRVAVLRRFAAAGLALLIGSAGAFAQSGTPTPQDQSGKPPAGNEADLNKDNQRKTDEFVEAAQAINGPGGNPECVWLGRRVVRLMWRDDLDTAFRHLDLYDRFGCPGGHVQATFRCLTRFGGQIDPKVAETLDSRPRLLDQSGRPAPGCRGGQPARRLRPPATRRLHRPLRPRRPPAQRLPRRRNRRPAFRIRSAERSYLSGVWIGRALKTPSLKKSWRHTSCEIAGQDYPYDAAVPVEPRGQVRFP